MGWTDERIEQLTQLWRAGRSASQIAAAMGGITRNAVIGKAHRLGLSARPSPIKVRSRSSEPRRVVRTEPRPVQTMPTQRPLAAAPMPRATPVLASMPAEPRGASYLDTIAGPGATILTVSDRVCRWPIGDPRDPDFHFCGRASSIPHPYCAEHASVAYQVRRSAEGAEERRASRY